MSDVVRYELAANVAVITIDHRPVNAAALAVRQGIMAALQVAEGDASQALVIICAGRTFVAGADINEFANGTQEPWLPEVKLGLFPGAGFYRYDAETRAHTLEADTMDLIGKTAAAAGVTQRDFQPGEIVDRLLGALASEGQKIVAEGIAQRPGDIDIVYIYGYGFPAWRGGPMYYTAS